jgi:hypothetical protein
MNEGIVYTVGYQKGEGQLLQIGSDNPEWYVEKWFWSCIWVQR